MSTTRKPIVTRSSLACLRCRTRHQKCDAKKPRCSRCIDSAGRCEYAKSRRGGGSVDNRELGGKNVAGYLDEIGDESVMSNLQTPSAMLDGVSFATPSSPQRLRIPPTPLSDGSSRARRSSQTLRNDTLIDAYYNNLHKFHPIIFPRARLLSLNQDTAWQPRLAPLMAVLRLIGNIYISQEWSSSLHDSVEAFISQGSSGDPIMVQARLLYSVALFWQERKAPAMREISAAAEIALELKMFNREFAEDNAAGDAVVAESWRRTWWMLYILDGFYAGTLGTLEYNVMHIEATVDLPCEEYEYESEDIPKPKTLNDWDCREFAADDVNFSSFAYLIGAVRCAAAAKRSTLKDDPQKASSELLHGADSILDGWLLLLPKGRKQIMTRNGEIDELMFQAHLLIHVVIIGFHRPLSDLKFNAVEDVSSCARDPAPDVPTPEHINVHTVRVVRSVEAQIGILALPARPFNHTPFSTCMVSEGTLALLSACKFLLRGTELAIARDQIRLTIGCLRAIGETWPRTARNVSEIQIIARHVLGIDSNDGYGDASSSDKSSVPSSDIGPAASESGNSSLNSDVFSSIQDIGDLCGWYNLDEMNSGLSWWATGT